MSGRGLLVGALGFLVGAAAVVGAYLALADPEPRNALAVAPGFCERALAESAGRWRLTVLPQETVTADRDELTTCAATTTSGDVRLTLTVLALAEEEGREPTERTSTMVELACTALQPDAAPDGDGCDGPVRTVDELVGSASAFVTGDDRAVVTVILTAPPDRAVGAGREVAAIAQALAAGVDVD